MNACSEDIKDILVAESSLSLVFSTDLFIGKQPAEPDMCACIFDSPGMPPQRTMGLEKYEYPSIQILTRDNAYMDSYSLADNIKDVLQGYSHETINGTFYSVIWAEDSPAFLYWDENNRAIFSINFSIQRR